MSVRTRADRLYLVLGTVVACGYVIARAVAAWWGAVDDYARSLD